MTAIRALERPPLIATTLAAAALALLTLVACRRIGPAGLAVPLVALAALLLLQRPGVALGTAVALAVVWEDQNPGLLPSLAVLYRPLPGGASPLELLFGLAVVAAALELLRRQRPVRLPHGLTLPLALLVLALVAGGVDRLRVRGRPRGRHLRGARDALRDPAADRRGEPVRGPAGDPRDAARWPPALAIFKAVIGLLAVAAGRGIAVDGATITYYEPVANFLMMLVLLGTLAAVLSGVRVPLWVLLGAPLMLLSLALSFRRSFWIGVVLGAAARAAARHLAAWPPAAAAHGRRWWRWRSGRSRRSASRARAPIVERVESLKPSKIEINARTATASTSASTCSPRSASGPLTRPRAGRAVEQRARGRCRSSTRTAATTCTPRRCGTGSSSACWG